MKVYITHTRMLHKGESKYYSVLEVVAQDNSKSITVCHYGGMPKHTSRIPNPGEMGKIIIHMGKVASSKIWEKEKRGYAKTKENVTNLALASSSIDEIFGKYAHEVRGHFNTLGYESDEDEAPSAKVDNTKTVAIQPEPERPAGWGSW